MKFSGFYTPLKEEDLKDLKPRDYIFIKVQVTEGTLQADKTAKNVFAVFGPEER